LLKINNSYTGVSFTAAIVMTEVMQNCVG